MSPDAIARLAELVSEETAKAGPDVKIVDLIEVVKRRAIAEQILASEHEFKCLDALIHNFGRSGASLH